MKSTKEQFNIARAAYDKHLRATIPQMNTGTGTDMQFDSMLRMAYLSSFEDGWDARDRLESASEDRAAADSAGKEYNDGNHDEDVKKAAHQVG